jgi:hypothetical protein
MHMPTAAALDAAARSGLGVDGDYTYLEARDVRYIYKAEFVRRLGGVRAQLPLVDKRNKDEMKGAAPPPPTRHLRSALLVVSRRPVDFVGGARSALVTFICVFFCAAPKVVRVLL